MTTVNANLQKVILPFKVIHGLADDVTSYKGSQRLYDEAASTDKEILLLDGEDHLLLRKGRTEAEDAKRQKLLGEMLDWLNRH